MRTAGKGDQYINPSNLSISLGMYVCIIKTGWVPQYHHQRAGMSAAQGAGSPSFLLEFDEHAGPVSGLQPGKTCKAAQATCSGAVAPVLLMQSTSVIRKSPFDAAARTLRVAGQAVPNLY